MRNYFVKRTKVHLDPEEILLDNYAKEQKDLSERLELSLNTKKIKIFFWVSFIIFAILFGRLFYLNIIQGNYYKYRAEHNRIRYFYLPAPRGIIYDRYGNPLTQDVPSYSLVMIPYDLPTDKQSRDALIKKIVQITNIDRQEIEKYLLNPPSNPLEPVLLKPSLKIEEVRRLETQIKDNAGFQIIKDNSRLYLYPEEFSHVLGYLGKMSKEDIKKYPDYPLTTMVGKDGLEKYYEKILQGKPGRRLIEVDAQYHLVKELGVIPPKKGNDIVTSLDKDLQLYFYQVLKKRIQELGIQRGIGIALNPKTGEILSLVNIPSFNPNILTQGRPKVKVKKYLTDKNHPLFNRAIGGLYHPGSVIKPLMALAVLEEHLISPFKKIYDTGEIVITNPYHPEVKYVFRDWKKHGWVDLRRAIAVSCNYYFWSVGGGYKDIPGLGWQRIKKYWLLFGLDKKLGIDLPGENQSILPDPNWLAKVRPQDPVWRLGDTYNISIGEGGLLLTPLQMIAYISTIANGGILYRPHLVKEIKGIENEQIFPQVILKLPVDKDNLRIVQEGMRMVVTEGTAMTLKDLPVEVAGKSGSPKFISAGKASYHALFIGYAPYKDPQIVVLVLLEKPPTGSIATLPVVKEVLSWYWQNRLVKNDKLNNN